MEKKSKKSIIIGISVLLLVTLTLLGLTYAYYRTRIIGNPNNESISVVSKKIEIKYEDDNAVIIANGIEPGYNTSKNFTVQNTGDDAINYSIKLDNISSNFSRNSDWSFSLVKVTNEGEEIIKKGILPNTTTWIVNSINIAAGATETFKLNINYANLTNENQSIDMGKSLSLRINIADELETELDKATEGTLLKAIANNNMISEPLTIPGEEPSSDTEAVFASTEGVGGDTYYFRGNVENNYVTYSGMCWRIVRVMENGDIKITLADRDNACGTANGYSVDDTDGAFIAEEKEDFDYKEYHVVGAIEFAYKDSDAAATLKAWAGTAEDRTYKYYDVEDNWSKKTGTFTNPIFDTTKLSSTPNWCIDTSEYENDGEVIRYGAYGRLSSREEDSHNPSLNCASPLENESQIGILSADEVAFAGATTYKNGLSWNYYLKTNATAVSYYTMSPDSIDDQEGALYIYVVRNDGSFSGSDLIGGSSIRPAVVLDSSVVISSGNGTIDDPYIIS